MGTGGVILDTVSGTQIFDLIFKLDFESALEDVVKLLSGMGGKVDGVVLFLRRSRHQKGICLTVLEQRGEVKIFKAAPPSDRHTPIFGVGHIVETEFGGIPCDKGAHIHAQLFGAAVNKCKGAVNFPSLMSNVFSFGNARNSSHFRN